MELLLVRQI
jgi:hypothetical protein